MTRLYLIRHVEAEGNLYRIAQGQYDGSVTLLGEAQLACIAEYFKSVPIDAVYASDLYRAYRTGCAAASGHGLKVTPDTRLREIGYGPWVEAQAWSDLERDWPEELAIYHNDLLSFRSPGGEFVGDIGKRMTDSIREIAQRHPNQTVAVASHCLALTAFFSKVLQVPRLPYMHNAAITIMDCDGENFTMVEYDRTSHLDALAPRMGEFAKRPNVEFGYRPITAADSAFIHVCAPELTEDTTLSGFIALDKDISVGFILWDADRIGYFALLDAYRGHGNGAQLIGRVAVEGRRHNIDALTVDVPDARDGVLRFLCRLGFVRQENGQCQLDIRLKSYKELQ